MAADTRRRTGAALLWAALLVLAGMSGCRHAAPGGPAAAPLDAPFVLRAGETGVVGEEVLRITFVELLADGRCPEGTQCVWAGEARAAFDVELPGAVARRLTLVLPGGVPAPASDDASAVVGDYHVRLSALAPYPQAGARTDEVPRATLVVTRRDTPAPDAP